MLQIYLLSTECLKGTIKIKYCHFILLMYLALFLLAVRNWEQSCIQFLRTSCLNINHGFRQRHQINSNTSAFLNANVPLSIVTNSYKRPKDDKRWENMWMRWALKQCKLCTFRLQPSAFISKPIHKQSINVKTWKCRLV